MVGVEIMKSAITHVDSLKMPPGTPIANVLILNVVVIHPEKVLLNLMDSIAAIHLMINIGVQKVNSVLLQMYGVEMLSENHIVHDPGDVDC